MMSLSNELRRGSWVQVGDIRNFVVILAIVAGFVLTPVSFASVQAAESDDTPIVAKNAVVVDADSGEVLFQQGMHEQVAPASLTKIFTAIVALESAPLDSEMVVDEYDLVGEASIGVSQGDELTMETLLHGLMLTSGNDSAMTIAREIGSLPADTPQESISRFMDRVNGMVERLGLSNTTLLNPHGLDQDGHVSSASDIAAMTMYALDNPVFVDLISTPYYSGHGREFYNANEFLDVYPGLIGGKTGVTSESGYSLVQAAERDDNTVIAVLLGSTQESWYADAEYLLNRGFDELAENPDDDSREVIGLGGSVDLDVPEITGSTAVGGNLTVDRVSDYEAVIRPSTPISSDEPETWRWLLVATGTMGLALVVVLNFPALVGIGALAVDRGSRIQFSLPPLPSLPSPRGLFNRPQSRPRRNGEFWQPSGTGNTQTRQPPFETEPDYHRPTPRQGDDLMNPGPYATAVTVSPARTRAEGAIKLAMQGRYHLATEEFRSAIERDPDVDLSSCPGFWRMQPMGYIAAAKAYAMSNQTREARRLLTVVQLAFKQNHSLVGLFGRAIKELED